MVKRICCALVLLSGCATTFQDASFEKSEFKRTMPLCVNETCGVGVVIVPKASSYKIRGKIKGSAEALFIDSCHRDVFSEDKDEVKYDYVPVKGIEDNRHCFVEITALDQKSKHTLAFIDFENKDLYSLKAKVLCNTQNYEANGVSACQSVVGNIQQIMFENDVIAEGCEFPKDKKSVWEYKAKKGLCTVTFKEVGSNKFHVATLIGTDNVILQEL